MSNVAAKRTSIIGAAAFTVIIACLLYPVGLIVMDAIADPPRTGGPSQPELVVAPDPISDSVAATAAEFRVDESGAATYSIPLYGVPGTAGVAPKLSLNYSSQAGVGPLGKGWSIGGLSSITRCRATREAGDFIVSGQPVDGAPRPINFSNATDRLCLDGQRLIQVPNSPACTAVAGMSVYQYRTEIESFQRVCGYLTAAAPLNGLTFLTVERKDGSISWYGDRDQNATANRPDGYFNSSAPGKEGIALSWAQTRFQDSTGNYMDFHYWNIVPVAASREHLLREVRYTGKNVLPGQAGSALAPYARIIFNYSVLPATQQSIAYQSGGKLAQTRRLDSISSLGPSDAYARLYKLTYGLSSAGSGLYTMTRLQECRDNSAGAVCLAPTTFEWSAGRYEFATYERPADLPISISTFRGFKLADVDGDGRSDFVYIRDGSSGCSTDWITVGFGILDAAGRPSYQFSSPTCLPGRIRDRGDGAWHLFDYNGDGRDDLFVSGSTRWHLYASVGRGGGAFNAATDLIAAIHVPVRSGTNDQVQLADLNGDGLTDIVYPVGGSLRARVTQRSGASYAFGAEIPVHVDEASLGPIFPGCPEDGGWNPDLECTRFIAGAPTPKTNFMQMSDFNGDAASDVLLRVTEQVRQRINEGPGCETIPQGRSFSNGDGTAAYPYVNDMDRVLTRLQAAAPDQCWTTFITDRLHAFVISSQSASSLVVANYGDLSPGNPVSLTLGDTNSDGLTDAFVRTGTNNDWYSVINTGTRFNTGVAMGLYDFLDHARFADVNGDGRSDLLYVVNPGNQRKFYNVRYALPSGGYGPGQNLPGGNNATICEGGGCDHNQRVPIFSDLDGDGNVDFMSIKMDNNPDLIVSRASQRYIPRDVITKVTNGLGAITQITYAPLTNKDLYRRDSGSRNGFNWGRGSPVMDLLMPTYAVARAASSSPQAGNPGAMATVHYRYAGAKIQAGGRGFLGFREIVTADPNHAGGYVVSATTYAQNFPYVGMPLSTVKRTVSGAHTVPACLNGPINEACFVPPGQPFPIISGSMFSVNIQDWEADADATGTAYVPFAPGVQAPLHVRTTGTDETLRDPFTGAQTSRVATTFDYGAYGDVVTTSAETFTGAATTPMSTVLTSNSYAQNNPARWRLGRLTASSVTHRRPGGSNDIVRTTAFNYDMAGSATGLLTEERIQPGGGLEYDSRKLYGLDAFGNRTRSVTCIPNTPNCDPASLVFHPSSIYSVHRYSRVTYDSRGRFPVETYEPFWSGAGTTEQRTQRVVSRDIFGNVNEARDVNNVGSYAIAGALGRDYFVWAQTTYLGSIGDQAAGVRKLTTYRWCGTGTNQVSCPAGAKFRQQVLTTEAPSQWTWFDVLGRPIMKAAATFNEGITNKDIAATCTTYDAAGKPLAVSNPFFLPGLQGANGPTVNATVCTSGRLWTSTTYDLLGRPTRVTGPDATTATTAYSGLTTTVTDQRGHATIQVRNGKGELVQTTDANGFTATRAYTPDGNLFYIRRNAGRGDVQNSFFYDVLGRKTQQLDPDTGTSYFKYNALGELVLQIDGNGNQVQNWYDARGRVWRKRAFTTGYAVESQSDYVFDTAPYGLGQLASESITGQYANWHDQPGTALGFSRTYSYDEMGRAIGSATVIDGSAPYQTAVAYDARGRAWKARDASGRWSKSAFTPRGFARAVCNSSSTDSNPACPNSIDTYLATLETDAWGHVVRERRGNSAAMDVTRQYWAQTGRAAGICAGNATACNLVDEGYGWDAAGNLSSHQKETRYLEGFTYDRLNRMTEGRLLMQNGVTANTVMQQYHYDALGNICRRFTVGWNTRDYVYAGRAGCGLGGAMNSPYGGGSTVGLAAHQIRSLVGPDTIVHDYDNRGNQVYQDIPAGTSDRSIAYTADSKAHEIRLANGLRTRFWYGPDGQRYKREDGGRKTLYLGNVEIVIDAGVATTKRTIAGVMLQTVVGTTATNHYLFHDHLGSLVKVTNAAGGVIHSMDFLAFGGRRNVSTQHANGVVPSLTTRGFTGHEMVDGFSVVHMNGRIYDSYQGRFLQPDPLIQAPEDVQSWNAYTYVFNNPLANTDPTGMFSLRQFLRIAVAVVITVYTGGAAAGYWSFFGASITAGSAAAYGVVALGGFAAGYVSTGTLQGGLYGAFTAMAFYGVGQWANGANVHDAVRVGAHAMTGGVIEHLQGGNFGHGFVSAGMSKAVMGRIDTGNVFTDGMVAALAGGTISAMTGGKFANGALTTAMQFAFNQMGQGVAAKAAEQRYFRAAEKANQVRGYINEYITENPNKPIPLTASQLSAIAERDYFQAAGFNASNPKMSDIEYARNMQWGPGDGFMSAYMTQVFDISGLSGGYSGIHLGSDINYMLQGMAWTAKGIPMWQLNTAIRAHNGAQFSGDASSGNFSARNLIQIQHAQRWADFGHHYYKSRSNGE